MSNKHTCHGFFGRVLGCSHLVMIGFVLFVLTHTIGFGQHIWLLDLHSRIDIVSLVFLGSFAVSCYWWRYDRHRLCTRIISAAILLGFFLSKEGPHLGDGWVYSQAPFKNFEVWQSSMLGHLFYIGAVYHQINTALIPCTLGFVSVFLAFKIFDKLFTGKAGYTNASAYCALLFASSGAHLTFFYGYQEMTVVGLPFLLASVWYALTYLQTSKRIDHWTLVVSTILLTLAALSHGQYAFLLPALLGLIAAKALHCTTRPSWWQLITVTLNVTAVMLCTYGIIVTFIDGSSALHITIGDMHGGGDGARFVPLTQEKWTFFSRFLMFSSGHFREIGNILLLASPLIIAYPIVVGLLLLYKKFRIFSQAEYLYLSILTCGYLAFVFLWGFDLGFPSDYDLMITGSLPLTILLCALCIECMVHFRWFRTFKMPYSLAFVSNLYGFGAMSHFLQ